MINIPLVQRKLTTLTQYLAELRPLSKRSFEEYQKNSLIKRTAERLLMLIVEVASDINSHLVAKLTKKPAASYFDSFLQLGELKIVSDEFAKEIAKSAGLRNRLIHQYEEIEDAIVYESISEALTIFGKYIQAIHYFLNTLNEKPNHETCN